MNWKAILEVVIGALVALIVYDLFVKKLVKKDSFESDLEESFEEI